MIPVPAIEATAKALYERDRARIVPWGDTTLPDRRDYMDEARKALEAAAPHMLRDAWEAGCKKGLRTNPGWEDEALAANPYRTTK